MPLANFVKELQKEIDELNAAGTAKGAEKVTVKVIPAKGDKGPRYLLERRGEQEFIKMNSNSYLGMSLNAEVLAAEEKGARNFGVGPGAVRFISGSFSAHLQLEKKLAEFHQRGDCMITSSAYTSMLGVVSTLAGPETIILSDELNHNCIINAMKLARPKGKKVFPHLDLAAMENQIKESIGQCKNLLVITDGVFSMRGDYAPLDEMSAIIKKYNDQFEQDIVFLVDDSHGVGAYGATGRGTEELTDCDGVDVLVATLGKAFGVNGGYIVSDKTLITYLREKNPFYIYTNPITPSEATASLKAVQILDSPVGQKRLAHLAAMTKRFESGLVELGFETIPSPHPVVPLMVRDTDKTAKLVSFLHENGVLATGLNFPVVPKGDQLIRFQVSYDHTADDIDAVLDILKRSREETK
jgi:glycine C-acetyltransferase